METQQEYRVVDEGAEDIQCQAITLSGERCLGIRVKGDVLCFAHSALTADKRAEARTRGGRKRDYVRIVDGKVDVRSIEGLQAQLVEAIENLRSMDSTVSVANALTRAVSVGAELYSAAVTDERIAEIEEELRRDKSPR